MTTEEKVIEFEIQYEYLAGPALSFLGLVEIAQYLNKMHTKGWELCAANDKYLFFKREIKYSNII